MTIVIDTDFPPPPPRSAPNQKYPWHELEVGHSFLAPDAKLKTLLVAASKMKRRIGHQYVVRAVDGGVRVWRTA